MKHTPALLITLSFVSTLVLTGCQPPTEQEPPSKTEEVSIEEVKENTPSANHMPADPTGVWSTTDDQGRPFDILLYPNGQAVSTWSFGTAGAKGERGFWRKKGAKILILFSDGWTDILDFSTEPPTHRGFEPGRPLSQEPTNQATVQKNESPAAEFIGIWRLNKEPDGNYQYITLLNNGRALSTVNGGTEGHWEPHEGAARCTWPDGWIDVIERIDGVWRKKSWVGSVEIDVSQVDVSGAVKVGESPLTITP